jgi:hypothetical protein
MITVSTPASRSLSTNASGIGSCFQSCDSSTRIGGANPETPLTIGR